MLKEQKGITLVALIITIIVLVILVGVTVSISLNSGIIPNSKNAVDAYNGAQTNELTALNNAEEMMQNYINQYTTTEQPGA